ncbi:MAG: cell division protein ZapA [Eubacterium sp.]|nr:cell division protein ZapA [Eubacterium sp.]
MKNMNDTEVLIDGRRYTICGVESDEYMQKIASYINRKLTEFKKRESYRHMDMDLRNILLAINIADDYYKAKKRAQEFKSEGELKDKQVLDMKHEIISLQDKVKDYELKNGVLEASLEEAEKKIIELETQLKQRPGQKSRR